MECKAFRFYISREGGDSIYKYQLSSNEFYKEYFKLESYVNVFIHLGLLLFLLFIYF